MQKTYAGSCHCGAVRFEADIDLSDETSRCNCSMCSKGRFWKSVIPADRFRLLQGQEALTTYQASTPVHHFCGTCGIKPFGRVTLPEMGEFVAVNVMCLDDATDEELAATPVVYQDGRHDRWESTPAVTQHL